MVLFRKCRFRFLYLLALAQLVGGPLVLLQVTLFSKLVIREAPRAGLVTAVGEAWGSPEFQDSLTRMAVSWKGSVEPGKKEGKSKPDFPSAPFSPWNAESPARFGDTALSSVPPYWRTWNPRWPHAPPGPPPRTA